jgi:serine phosphatase RsbU (regulator of sigma subunit)
MAVLVLQNNNGPGQVIQLAKSEMIIGRRADCDIVLDNSGVSREHARIQLNDGNHFVIDLNSRNQTKVNEKRVEPGVEWLLKPGDQITICEVVLVYYPVYPPERPQTEGVEVVDGEDSTIHMLDASRSDLLASMVKPEVKLKAILQISRKLTSNFSIDTVAPEILDSLLEIFAQAERAFLVLLNFDDTGKWSFKQILHKLRQNKKAAGLRPLGAPADEPRMRISKAIINHVIDNRKAVLSQDASNDLNLPTSASIADLRIRSVMCSPLLTNDGQILGIIQLDTSDRRSFNQEDLDVLEVVARQATTALQNASMHEALLKRKEIERDLALAQTIQMRFIPRTVPTIEGFEFFAHYHAAYEVGGDYYDFVPLPDGKLAISLGDVSGKGVAAALVMAKFAGDARTCILTQADPARMISQANRVFCDAGIEERFITLSLSVLDPAARQLTYTSAGHLPILVRRRNGQVEEYGPDVSGFPLGIDNSGDYAQGSIKLDLGDVAVIYTDGVCDSRSPADEAYDTEKCHRLRNRVASISGGPAAMGKAILQELREFSAGQPQFDDITVVCFGPQT